MNRGNSIILNLLTNIRLFIKWMKELILVIDYG